MERKGYIKGYIFVISSALIFGLMPLMAKFIYAEGVNPVSLVFLRNVISVPVLAVLALCADGAIKTDLHQLPKICFVALMGCSVTPLLLFCSYNYMSSGTATVFHFVYPAVVVLGEILVFKSKIVYGNLVSVIMCVVGIAMFYNSGSSISLEGSVLALLSGVTYAIYVISLSAFKGIKTSIFNFSLHIASISSVVMLAVALATRQMTLPTSLTGWLLTVLFAVSLNVGAVVLFQKGTFLIGGSRASILSTFEPITSIFAGVIIFKESMTPLTVVGSLLVILASFLIAFLDMRRNKA